jgi:hypothetical protein
LAVVLGLLDLTPLPDFNLFSRPVSWGLSSIEDPLVIKKILDHLNAKSEACALVNQLPEPRAPPQAKLF